jgi:UPF0716 family protein affecting phage T7 exclusion
LIICAVVVLDSLLWGLLSYWFGWNLCLVEAGLTTIAGLMVIIYYEWRWSETVAEHLECEPVALDSWCLEKILLLICGFALLIPGLLTDLLGLLMLMPTVRRMIATTLLGRGK